MEPSNMPTSYETTTTTTTTTGPSRIRINVEYIKTIPGILKIAEIVIDLLVLICSVVVVWSALGWAAFLAIFALITTSINFALYLTQLNERIPGPRELIEFIYYIVITVLFLITAIVTAVHGWVHSAIAATAFFSFAATALYGVDTFFQFRVWHSGQSTMTTTTTTSHVTTTNVEAGTVHY